MVKQQAMFCNEDGKTTMVLLFENKSPIVVEGTNDSVVVVEECFSKEEVANLLKFANNNEELQKRYQHLLQEHENDGGSICGSYEEIKEEYKQDEDVLEAIRNVEEYEQEKDAESFER